MVARAALEYVSARGYSGVVYMNGSPSIPLGFPTNLDSGKTVGKLVADSPWSGVTTGESITPGDFVGGRIEMLIRGVNAGVLWSGFIKPSVVDAADANRTCDGSYVWPGA